MRFQSTLIISAAPLLLLTGAMYAADKTEDQAFMLGILRADGVLTPFAKYQNGTWSNPFPEPVNNEDTEVKEISSSNELPTFVYKKESWDIDPRSIALSEFSSKLLISGDLGMAKWHMISKKDKGSLLNVTEARQYQSQCSFNWGLKTDYRGSEHESHSWPIDKIGIASTMKLPISVMQHINEKTTQGAKVIAAVKQQWDQKESEAIKQAVEQYKGKNLPVTLQEREAVPLSNIDLVGTKTINGSRYYHVNAIKVYKKFAISLNDPTCYIHSIFEAWVKTDKGRPVPINAQAYFTDCDMKEGSYASPMAVMNIRNDLYTVNEESGYESESYVVARISATGIETVLTVDGGGC